jgi:hypothetical protein
MPALLLLNGAAFEHFNAVGGHGDSFGLACALHFVLGASLGLSVDEGRYALYAAHPDLSNFDHPPQVSLAQ